MLDYRSRDSRDSGRALQNPKHNRDSKFKAELMTYITKFFKLCLLAIIYFRIVSKLGSYNDLEHIHETSKKAIRRSTDMKDFVYVWLL